jgi:hypothetical protein
MDHCARLMQIEAPETYARGRRETLGADAASRRAESMGTRHWHEQELSPDEYEFLPVETQVAHAQIAVPGQVI